MNIKELKEAAEKATPGPWFVEDVGGNWSLGVTTQGDSEGLAVVWISNDPEEGIQRPDDARYIALANPSTILSLIARVEAAEKYAREASEALLKTRPLGGSEMFSRISDDEYLADPTYCGGLIDQLRADLRRSHFDRARAARALSPKDENDERT